jgi:hypothetical protein
MTPGITHGQPSREREVIALVPITKKNKVDTMPSEACAHQENVRQFHIARGMARAVSTIPSTSEGASGYGNSQTMAPSTV